MSRAGRSASSPTIALTTRPTGSIPGLVGTDSSTPTGSTVLTLGMRYKTSPTASFFADASSWRGSSSAGNGGTPDTAVAGKVGMEFKSAQSMLHVAYGGLGVRLAGDSKMTVKLRRGGLGVFMRSAF